MKINKIALSVFALALVTISCKKNEAAAEVVATEDTAVETTKTPVLAENVKTANFTIDGMSCQVMCASKIQKELEATAGVQKATVDFEKKSATVEYDAAAISPEKITEIVEAVGGGDLYKVSNLSSNADQAHYFQDDKKKSRKERRQERANKKSASEANTTSDAPAAKPGCCSSKKSCSKSGAQKS